jgi:hypothetical protein
VRSKKQAPLNLIYEDREPPSGAATSVSFKIVSMKMPVNDTDLPFVKTRAYVYVTSLEKPQFRSVSVKVTGFLVFVHFTH